MKWKIFQWMKFLFTHSSNSRKLSRQKFHYELACVFTAHLYASKNADWNQQQLTDGGVLANQNSANHCIVSYPIRKKSTFWLFWMWSEKEMYHALFPKTDYRDKGRGHDCRLVGEGRAHKQASKQALFESQASVLEDQSSRLWWNSPFPEASKASIFILLLLQYLFSPPPPPPQKNSLFRLGIVYIKGPLQIRVKTGRQPCRAHI